MPGFGAAAIAGVNIEVIKSNAIAAESFLMPQYFKLTRLIWPAILVRDPLGR